MQVEVIEGMELAGVRLRRSWAYGALGVIVVGTVVLRLSLAFRHPLVHGPDGAYYLAGVEDIFRGRLPWDGSAPPVFFALAALFRVFLEANAAVKVAGVAACALGTVASFFVARRVVSDDLGSLVTAAFVAFCAPYIWMMMDLLKNCLAIPLLFLVADGYRRYREGGKLRPLVVTAVLLFLTHPAVFCYAGLLLACSAAFESGLAGKLPAWRRPRKLTPLVTSCLLLLFLFMLFRDTLAQYLSGYLLRGGDFPQTGLPDPRPLAHAYGWLWTPVLLGVLLLAARQDFSHRFLLVWSVLAIALAQPPAPMSQRFLLMSFPPLALAAGLAVRACRDRLGKLACAAVTVALLSALGDGALQAGRDSRWQPVVAPQELPMLAGLMEVVPERAAVLAVHDGVEYWAAYVSGLRVKSVEPGRIWDMAVNLMAEGKTVFFLATNPGVRFAGAPAWQSGRFTLYQLHLAAPPPPHVAAVLRDWRDSHPRRAILELPPGPLEPGLMHAAARQKKWLALPKEAAARQPAVGIAYEPVEEREGLVLLRPRTPLPAAVLERPAVGRPPGPPPGRAGVSGFAGVATLLVLLFPVSLLGLAGAPFAGALYVAGLPLVAFIWGMAVWRCSRFLEGIRPLPPGVG